VIAFPQRDIHFDTDKPLTIQWIGQQPPSAKIPVPAPDPA
jgi:hypothetical protein